MLRAKWGTTKLEPRYKAKGSVTYLDVSLAVDVHVDERTEPDQTLSHLHVALPDGGMNRGNRWRDRRERNGRVVTFAAMRGMSSLILGYCGCHILTIITYKYIVPYHILEEFIKYLPWDPATLTF